MNSPPYFNDRMNGLVRERQRRARRQAAQVIIALFLLLFVIAASIGLWWNSVQIVEARVTDKERVVSGESSKWLVYTEGEVFKNTDAPLFGKWDSGDFQGRLKLGQTYRLTVVGWRIPFFSAYRNIIDVQG
jgi:hypothetical protein